MLGDSYEKPPAICCKQRPVLSNVVQQNQYGVVTKEILGEAMNTVLFAEETLQLVGI